MKNKTLIIAEIGNSHNGNFKYALRAINSAKKAGADAVKFQFIKPAELVHPYLKPTIQIQNIKLNLKNLIVLH